MAVRNYSRVADISYSETITSGQNGDTILINPVWNQSGYVTVRIKAGAGTGKVQITLVDKDKLEDGLDVASDWDDWPKGDVTGTDGDVLLAPVTAIRGVSVSGTVEFELSI